MLIFEFILVSDQKSGKEKKGGEKRRKKKEGKEKEEKKKERGKKKKKGRFFLLNARPCTKDSLARRGGVAGGDDGPLPAK